MWTRKIIEATKWRPLLSIVPLVVALSLGLWVRQVETRNRIPLPIAQTLQYDAVLVAKDHPLEPDIDIDSVSIPHSISLNRGQTLSGVLEDLGIEAPEAQSLLATVREHLDLRKLRQGEIGLAYFDRSADLSSLRLNIAGKGWLEVEPSREGWKASLHRFEREVRLRRIEGKLEDYLGAAIHRAGGSPEVADKMSFVLQWDLDFNRDLRVGDSFRVLYEEIYLDGELAGLGEVLALAYENRGQLHEAYRYGDKGHFDSAGRPLRKMFLKSPLPFTRVTSRFSHSRLHPILKKRRPHYGVDYGAPRGTPVRATASGSVLFAGRSGGAGNMVKLRHTNGYQTSYLHLSGFAKGVRRGFRVSQGQVIGYVGSTGLSTGPHLDYRVKKGGRWMDPLRLKSDPVEPIPQREMRAFEQHRDELMSMLEGVERKPRRQPPVLSMSATLASRDDEGVARGLLR